MILLWTSGQIGDDEFITCWTVVGLSVASVGAGWWLLEAVRDASPDAGGLAAGYALLGFALAAGGIVGAVASVPAIAGVVVHRAALGGRTEAVKVRSGRVR